MSHVIGQFCFTSSTESHNTAFAKHPPGIGPTNEALSVHAEGSVGVSSGVGEGGGFGDVIDGGDDGGAGTSKL